MSTDFTKMLKEDDPAGAASAKVIHDMRGPLINIQGFSDELNKAFGRIDNLLRDHHAEGSDEIVHQLRKIIEKDVEPCLDFLLTSVGKANDNLDAFANQITCLKSEP